MKRAKQILFGVGAAAAAAWGIVACQSIPIVPTTDCGSYSGVGYWHKEEPANVTVCLDDDEESAELQFKDSSGAPIPGGGKITAGGCITIPKPPNAAYVDWLDYPEPGAGEDALTLAPMLPWGIPTGAALDGGHEYLIGCAPLQANPMDKTLAYAIKVHAGSADEAKYKAYSIAYHGPGTIVPLGVTVGEYIEAEMEDTDLVIRSSLADRFAMFRIDINGEPVADLETGLNVEIARVGQGWFTLTTRLPIASLPEQLSLSLFQRAEHDPDEAQINLSF